MALSTDDFLVLQHELAELLKLALADMRPTVYVREPADMAADEAEQDAPAKAHPVPAVNVVYIGHKPSLNSDRQRTDGRAALISQLFALEVVTRNVTTLKTGAAARDESGKLAMRVVKAAMGAKLPSASSTVAFIPGPGPKFKGGMQYLPLLFQVDLGVFK